MLDLKCIVLWCAFRSDGGGVVQKACSIARSAWGGSAQHQGSEERACLLGFVLPPSGLEESNRKKQCDGGDEGE